MISLGQASNYSLGQVFGQLVAWGAKRDSDELRSKLAKRYQVKPDQVALYHTGRSALTVAIRAAAQDKAMNVIIPGLTCIAVLRAVKAAGCNPVFVDIKADDLSYNYEKLAQKLQELSPNLDSSPEKPSPSPKAIDKNDEVCYNGSIVLVQNTLGITWDIEKIQTIVQKHQAIIVEDLAHSAGRKYPNGQEVGAVGAAAALSFGKGKAIDTISGGAVILRDGAVEQPTQKPKLSDRLRDRWYPLFGSVARVTGKLGQIAMGCLVKIHWVQRSADAELNPNWRLTHWQAKLASRQLDRLPTSRLRDYRLVKDRIKVLTELSQNGYNFSEIWYDTPVSPRRYAKEANFPEQECPATVQISQQIINLPTWYKEEKLKIAYEIIKRNELK